LLRSALVLVFFPLVFPSNSAHTFSVFCLPPSILLRFPHPLCPPPFRPWACYPPFFSRILPFFHHTLSFFLHILRTWAYYFAFWLWLVPLIFFPAFAPRIRFVFLTSSTRRHFRMRYPPAVSFSFSSHLPGPYALPLVIKKCFFHICLHSKGWSRCPFPLLSWRFVCPRGFFFFSSLSWTLF